MQPERQAKHPYFDSWKIALSRSVAKILRKASKGSASSIYQRFSGLLPGHSRINVQYIENHLCKITAHNKQVYFPFNAEEDLPFPVVHMMSVNIIEWLKQKYQYPGFVEVENGDIVIDCGSFVGGFSLSAADRARQIYAFEPSPMNFTALTLNTRDMPNIEPIQMGLYNKTTSMSMNMSSTRVDDSLLSPDNDEGTGRTTQISLTTLDEWAAEKSIESIDFVKLEAEGVENEVLEGIRKVRVRKFAVDCSPERDGQSNLNEIRGVLESRGYETQAYRFWLYAREKT